MASICGIYNKKGKPVYEADIKKMVSKLNHWEAKYQWFNCQENFAFGKLSHYPINYIKVDYESSCVSTLNPQRNISEDQIFNILQENNIEELREVYDDFAFALKKSNSLILGRDHFGKKPLFYFESKEIFAFSSEIKGLLSPFDIPRKLSEEWLIDFLSNSISGKEITPYKTIKKIKPGHVLKVSPTKTEEIQFWDLVHEEKKDILEEETIREFRNILMQSIKEKSFSHNAVGSELSGGLDSSVIASVANTFCKKQNVPFFSLSHINPDKSTYPFKDEKQYIQQVVEHAKIKNPLFIDSKEKGILTSIDENLTLMDGPVSLRYYLFSDSLYETAKKYNIHTLLSGFGGDEMVTSETPGYFHELASTEWMRFFSEQLKTNKSLSKKLQTIVNVSIATRLSIIYKTWLKFAGQERKRIKNYFNYNNAIRKELIKKHNLLDRALQNARFPNQSSVHERQYERIMNPILLQRLENSAIAALHHGIEYHYPLLDVRLVKFYYSLPTHLKIKGETRRYIYRKAIKDIVPESIRWRNDKSGATIPSVQKRFLNDYENIKKFIIQCKKNGVGDEYFDFNDMLSWQEAIKNRNEGNKIPVHQGQFFNFLMLLRFLDNF